MLPAWAERVGTVFLSHIQGLRSSKLPVGMQGPLPTPAGCSPPLPVVDSCLWPQESFPCRRKQDGVFPDILGIAGAIDCTFGLLGFQQLLLWGVGMWLAKPGINNQSEGSQAVRVPCLGLSQLWDS